LVVYKSGGCVGLPGNLFWELYDQHQDVILEPNRIIYTEASNAEKREKLKELQEEVFNYYNSLSVPDPIQMKLFESGTSE
jgi:hypothetical protein